LTSDTTKELNYIAEIQAVNGYVNFHVKLPRLAAETINAARVLQNEFGYVKVEKSQNVIVEHTSANPSGPIHAGTSRSSILGDAIARLISARGHVVRRHFYVDDVGRQIAQVVYGYRLLGQPPIEGKPDVWLGFLYAAVNTALTIRTLKAKIDSTNQSAELIQSLKRELDDYVATAAELEIQNKDLFHKIITGVTEDRDPEDSINKILREYENQDAEVKIQIRMLAERCRNGFAETLDKANITIDSWDWESDLVWSGEVSKAIQELMKTPFMATHEGALALNADTAATTLGLKDGMRLDQELPPLVLRRTDGTTLYTTRDVAYHLRKFEWADRAVNIIGSDQKLAQLHLKIALVSLGVKNAAQNLIHYAYELVNLPGYRMSRRRGRYVSFDEVLEQSVTLAKTEVHKRVPEMSEQEKNKIAEIVGIGAVKYAILGVSASKAVVFTWDRVLNFEANSAPFVQYAHARASSILRKQEQNADAKDYSILSHSLERTLLVWLARFPETFTEASDAMKPELIAEYANELADNFNAFYKDVPVLKADLPQLTQARLDLVWATKTVLHNALALLGIYAPDRM
ncbi:MAG: arginine--tRNA ligase, partial [Candidatus Bathyarchaeia archaeon]